MDVIVEEVNQFTKILVDMGCDVTKIPHNQLELGVLWIQYSWAVFLLGLGIKSFTKLFSVFALGRGGRL
ncbi:MAG: hypothetical protein IJP18_04250 [Oscillospiraceae bacterium]|nr:hypothetical protein [Oscillospiraceae bacterium]